MGGGWGEKPPLKVRKVWKPRRSAQAQSGPELLDVERLAHCRTWFREVSMWSWGGIWECGLSFGADRQFLGHSSSDGMGTVLSRDGNSLGDPTKGSVLICQQLGQFAFKAKSLSSQVSENWYFPSFAVIPPACAPVAPQAQPPPSLQFSRLCRPGRGRWAPGEPDHTPSMPRRL